MNRALILGCSHAAGSEVSQDPTIKNNAYLDAPYSHEAQEFERMYSYPARIAEALGFMIDNKAIAGGSNDAIFRIFEASRLEPGDIVIACWTGANRGEIFHEGDWKPLSPGFQGGVGYREYQKQWLTYHASPDASRLNKIKNILALNALAELRGIKVINIESFDAIRQPVWPKNVYWATAQDFIGYCDVRNYACSDMKHYFLEAHQSYADFVLKSIETTFLQDTPQ